MPHLANWSLDRLGALERNILRLAASNLCGEEHVPAAVAVERR